MEGATEMNVNNAAGTDYALVCIYLNQYYSFFYLNAFDKRGKKVFGQKKSFNIFFFIID